MKPFLSRTSQARALCRPACRSPGTYARCSGTSCRSACGRSNRCFLFFFSRESPSRYLQWNAKKKKPPPERHLGPAGSRIPFRASGNAALPLPQPEVCSQGVTASVCRCLKISVTPPVERQFFTPREGQLVYQQMQSVVHPHRVPAMPAHSRDAAGCGWRLLSGSSKVLLNASIQGESSKLSSNYFFSPF